MAGPNEKLIIPSYLIPNQLTGGYLVALLRRKWHPSWQLTNLIVRLKNVHELSLRSPETNIQYLERYCERLTLLNVACRDANNCRGGTELEVADATGHFTTMWEQLKGLMRLLIERSADFLRTNDSGSGVRVSIQNTVTSRMHATLNMPDEYPDEFKKKPANLWNKTAGRAGMVHSAAGEGVSMAQNVMGIDQDAMLVAAATGSAAATGPVGLAVAGGIHATIGSGLAARASYRSHRHIRRLEEIKRNVEMYPSANGAGGSGIPCQPLPGGAPCNDEHNQIKNEMLPYLIRQKMKKRGRKGLSAVPVIGMAEGIRGMAKGSYKRLRGTKGKARNAMTAQLTTHFMQCDCKLAQDIVSDLLSSKEKMEWLRWQDYDLIFSTLKEKFKGS